MVKKTFQYYWEVFIGHPLDIADRLLILVGAIFGFLQKGDDPVTWALAWQIPVAIIVILLIWHLIQIPVKVVDDVRRAKLGELPLTIEGIDQRIKQIEESLPKVTTLKIEDIEKKIFWEFKSLDDSGIGGITRYITFIFEVTNASSVWINFTGNVKGFLSILGWNLFGVNWQVFCDGIDADNKGNLLVVFPVSERLAHTLAFQVENKTFFADFSKMFVEVEIKDNQQVYTLGYVPIGIGKIDIPIEEHRIVYPKLRKIVEWEDKL